MSLLNASGSGHVKVNWDGLKSSKRVYRLQIDEIWKGSLILVIFLLLIEHVGPGLQEDRIGLKINFSEKFEHRSN